LPPYDLWHAFASLQIRAGVSIPELAEQMGHSRQMTVGTYTHVIRKLKGQPTMVAEDQIERARREHGGRLVDVDAVSGGTPGLRTPRVISANEAIAPGGFEPPTSRL
jgi:hypothetical protein